MSRKYYDEDVWTTKWAVFYVDTVAASSNMCAFMTAMVSRSVRTSCDLFAFRCGRGLVTVSAHDDRYIHLDDHVIKLEAGRVVESKWAGVERERSAGVEPR